MDETTLTLHPILRKCWMKRGQQRAIPAAGQQQCHHLFAAYDFVTGHVYWTEAKSKNTDSFILFLEHLMAQLTATCPVVLVLDNASYHHSAAAHAALACFEEDRLLPLWLPPYCSLLNLIERFWEHLKRVACANKLFSSVQSLLDSARRCLEIQNSISSHKRFLFLNT